MADRSTRSASRKARVAEAVATDPLGALSHDEPGVIFDEFSDDVLVDILSRLSKRNHARTLAVCRRWERLHISVGIMRRKRPLLPDKVFLQGEGSHWRTLGGALPLPELRNDLEVVRNEMYEIKKGLGRIEVCAEAGPDGQQCAMLKYTRAQQSNGERPWQWCGWQMQLPPRTWMRVSCWLRFKQVPPKAQWGNFGLKLHGRKHTMFMEEVKAWEWCFVSAIDQASGGDGSHILLIFDSMHGPNQVLIKDLTLELFDSNPQAQAMLPQPLSGDVQAVVQAFHPQHASNGYSGDFFGVATAHAGRFPPGQRFFIEGKGPFVVKHVTGEIMQHEGQMTGIVYVYTPYNDMPHPKPSLRDCDKMGREVRVGDRITWM